MLRKVLLLSMMIVTVYSDENWEELFSVENRNDLQLSIYSEIPGSIIWKSSNKSLSIVAKAKIYNQHINNPLEDSQMPLTTCKIDTQVKNGRVTVRIFPKMQQPVATNYQRNGGFALLYSYILTLCIMTSVHGFKAAVTYSMLLLTVFTFADMCLYNITRIDIIIEYPENVHFQKITLYMKDGNITSMPESKDTEVTCATDRSSNDTGCISCCHGNGVCKNGNKCYCDKGYDDRTNCKMKIVPRHTVYINPVDQRIVHLHLSSNLNITAYGKRDVNGSVKSLKSFQSRDHFDRSINILMGKLRRVSKVTSSSGTAISFDWRNKCNVHVTVIFNQGKGQVDQDVILCKYKPKRRPIPLDGDDKINLLPTSTNEKQSRSKRIPTNVHNGDFIKLPVDIKSCNEPDSSAVVSASVVSTNETYNNKRNYYIGSLTEYPGLYYIKLPAKPAILDRDDENNVCSSLTKTTTHVCKYVMSNYNKLQHHICNKIRSSMKVMTEISYAYISDVITTCESSFQTLVSFCTEYFESVENSCNRDNVIFYDSFVPGNVSVVITATFPGNYSVYSDTIYLQVKENSPYVAPTKMITDSRPKPRFIGFSVEPRDPQPFERYQVKIDYACASSTTKLEMRIEGSDKYHNKVTCIGITPCNCCVLHVAGAAGLVMDKVFVSLNDPPTQTLTSREIAVLF